MGRARQCRSTIGFAEFSSVHMSILRRQADARRTYPLFLSRRAHRGINLGENRWSTVAVGASQTGGSFLCVADVAKRFATAPPGDSSRREESASSPPFPSSFPDAHSSDTGIGFMTEPSLAIEMK